MKPGRADTKRAGTDNRKQTVEMSDCKRAREITDGVCCYSQPTNTCSDLPLSQTDSENSHTGMGSIDLIKYTPNESIVKY